MKNPVDTQLISLRCEQCGQQKEARLGWLKDHDELACDCGHPIAIRANDLVDAVKRCDAVRQRLAMPRPAASRAAVAIPD